MEYDLTFAGVPFIMDRAKAVRMPFPSPHGQDADQYIVRKQQPEANLIEEIDRLIPFRYLQDFALPSPYPGKNLGAIANQTAFSTQPNPSIRIGDWYYPHGASRWSVFRGLATSAMAKAMLAETNGTTAKTFKMKCYPDASNPNNYVASDYTITTSMYMLPPRPLGELGGTFDGLYLITLVDERYYFQGAPTLTYLSQFNLKGGSWTNIVQGLSSSLGVTISFSSSIPAAYSTPELDSQFWENYESAPAILDAVAFNLGCQVVRGFDGTYTIQTPIDSQTIVNANRGSSYKVVRTAGGDLGADNYNSGSNPLPIGDLKPARNAIVPSNIYVTFPYYVFGDDPVPHYLNSRYANQRQTAWYEDSYGSVYAINVPIASGGSQVSGLTGTSTQFVHTTAKALISGEANIAVDPINASGLTALAMQIATDKWNAQVAAALDEVYPGIRKWTPEGIHDIIWSWREGGRQVTTRVMRTEWNQDTDEFQHAASPVSGQTAITRGVGGQSVAQSWRDGQRGPAGGAYSGMITTTLASGLASGDYSAYLISADNFPTQNRWRGRIDGEDLLFEGTSGGVSVGIVFRGIDGTIQIDHANGSTVRQILPNTTYGVNLVNFEKMQFAYPQQWSSGGVQGINVVPQTQSITALAGSGIKINNIWHYSGRVDTYDPTLPVTPWVNAEYAWVVDRNTSGAATIQSGFRYGGQLVGHSASISGSAVPAPVYAVDNVGGGVGGDFLAQLTAKNYSGVVFNASRSGWVLTDPGFTMYSWAQVNDTENPLAISYYSGSMSGGPGNFPAYHEQNIDHPTFPIVPYYADQNYPASGVVSGQLLSGGGTQPLSVVRMRKGAGPYYLFDQMPWEDLFRRTGNSDAYGVVGYFRIWNQNSGIWMDGQEVRIVLAE